MMLITIFAAVSWLANGGYDEHTGIGDQPARHHCSGIGPLGSAHRPIRDLPGGRARFAGVAGLTRMDWAISVAPMTSVRVWIDGIVLSIVFGWVTGAVLGLVY